MNVSADPSAQLLVPGGFGISVGTRAQHHHEQRGWPGFAGKRIVYRSRGTGPVDEALLARLVYLAKNYILLSAPTLVELAEATVAVSFRMNLLERQPLTREALDGTKAELRTDIGRY